MGVEALHVHALGQGVAKASTTLAKNVVEDLRTSGQPQFKPLYPDEMPLFEKIHTIAKRNLSRATEATADKSVQATSCTSVEEMGYGNLPVCIGQDQYSFSTNPNCAGRADRPHRAGARSAGSRPAPAFIVAICGEIMTMPGLPKVPSADKIYLNEQGHIVGLF